MVLLTKIKGYVRRYCIHYIISEHKRPDVTKISGCETIGNKPSTTVIPSRSVKYYIFIRLIR